MKILVDLNLAPAWARFLREQGIEATHWSEVGDLRAPDAQIMQWAREHGCVVFTHDLDYSALLAATRASGPSVLQVRTQDVLPSAIGELVVRVLGEHADALAKGAILTVDLLGARVRSLPIERGR
jgi:predicted nuclease of predicted toxin-antitoxin system